PFFVNTQLRDWNIEPDKRRCAVVSSFGFSGTNAHVVVEESSLETRKHGNRPGYLVVLSARTVEQLQQQVDRLIGHCERKTTEDCGNISYTLLLGRRHLRHRLACVVRDTQELRDLLRRWLEKGKAPQVYVSRAQETEQSGSVSLERYGKQCLEECKSASTA